MNKLYVAQLDSFRATATDSGSMPARSIWYLCCAALLAAFLLLSGCGGGGGGGKGPAQLRMLNVSPDYDSLDMYVSDGTDGADNQKFSAIGNETVSTSTTVNSGTYSIKFKRAGIATTLLTLSDSPGKDSHSLYVTYGSTGRFGAIKIGEDVTAPDTNRSNVQVMNTAEAGSLDVYLTDASVALTDATPQVGGIASGALSATTTIDSGTYRLRVTGTGDKTDLRLDISNLTFDSKKTSTLVLTATKGGVLVNALRLSQQEADISKSPNPNARVRAAVGISNGNLLTASIGGVTVVSGAASGVIGSKYLLVPAGTAAVATTLDGTPVTIPSQTLTAGADYTLLFWNNASGTQATLITDGNRLPTTAGKSKIRLMNGMSALAVPATLAVDFAPISEGVELGQAAASTEIDSASAYQLDVTNTSTSASLLTRDSVALQDAGIYTMFMWGGGATPVSGTLRKDR